MVGFDPLARPDTQEKTSQRLIPELHYFKNPCYTVAIGAQRPTEAPHERIMTMETFRITADGHGLNNSDRIILAVIRTSSMAKAVKHAEAHYGGHDNLSIQVVTPAANGYMLTEQEHRRASCGQAGVVEPPLTRFEVSQLRLAGAMS